MELSNSLAASTCNWTKYKAHCLGHIVNKYVERTRTSVLTHTFLTEISLELEKSSVYMSKFFPRRKNCVCLSLPRRQTLDSTGKGGWMWNLFTCEVLQPKHMNKKFLYACFSTYASVLHLHFSSCASECPPEYYSGRHRSTSLSLLTPLQSSIFPFFCSSALIIWTHLKKRMVTTKT